jgi:hypothetical protein
MLPIKNPETAEKTDPPAGEDGEYGGNDHSRNAVIDFVTPHV